MKFTVLTMLPDLVKEYFEHSVIKKAKDRGAFKIEVVNIRDFSQNKHRHVDDSPYGGGAGMLLQIDPLLRALEHVKKPDSHVLLTSPKAHPFNQKKAAELAQKDHLVFICGHYEGVDARIEKYVDENISIGDYIMTGGELASLVVIDAVSRLLDNSINRESLKEESFDNHLLEYPQYSRPSVYRGMKVPEVLLSGNHQMIKRWRTKMALLETLKYRKDLLHEHRFTQDEIDLLHELYQELKDGLINI